MIKNFNIFIIKNFYFLGFDATSNVLAGKLFGIPVRGTQAHSFISSFSSSKDLKNRMINSIITNEPVDIYKLCLQKLDMLFNKVFYFLFFKLNLFLD